MNKLKIILHVILLLNCCTNLKADNESPKIQCPNGVAAIVDTRVITLEDLQRKLAPFVAQLQRECTNATQFNEKLGPLAQQVLDKMIDDILLVNSFMTDKTLRIPESFLENHYSKFLIEHFQNNRSNYLEYLAAEGKTDREVREQQKEDVILGFLRGRMRRSELTISSEQIKKYYEENQARFIQNDSIHLRQIVLKNEPESTDTEKPESTPSSQKTQSVIKLLRDGKPFAEVAKEFSQDGMEKSGGDLGWISPSDIHQELSKVAFSLNKGQFSDPITLNNHTFILFIEDKKTAGLVPLDKVSNEIAKTLSNDYAKQYEAQYVQKLRKKALIKYCL